MKRLRSPKVKAALTVTGIWVWIIVGAALRSPDLIFAPVILGALVAITWAAYNLLRCLYGDDPY